MRADVGRVVDALTFAEDVLVVEGAQQEVLLAWESEGIVFALVILQLHGALLVWGCRGNGELSCRSRHCSHTLSDIVGALAGDLDQGVVNVAAALLQ